jgi:CHAD domain-containing protein
METKEIQRNLLNRLALLQKAYETNLTKVYELFDDEAIHDFRVAIRRILAFIRFVDIFCPIEINANLRTLLKSNIKQFNKLRDIQVQIQYLINFLKKFPETIDFLVFLKKEEKKQIQKLKKVITSSNFDNSGEIFYYRMHLMSFECFQKIDFDGIIIVLKDVFREVEKAISNIIENDFATFHKTRLAFKRFRYTVETIESILSIPKAKVKELQNIQTVLGEIQDYTVTLALLEKFSKGDLFKFSNFVEFIKQKREGKVKEFWEMLAILEFWRDYIMKN